MHALVTLQHADGSWDLTLEFAHAIGHDLKKLESTLPGVIGDTVEARRAFATALALAWLEEHARDVQELWRLLAVKGQRWLRSARAQLADGTVWAEAGTTILATLA